MNSEEISESLQAYNKLETECKRIAKMYLDYEAGGEYCGSVSNVQIFGGLNDTFDFRFYPCSSGMGGSGTLSLNYVRNNGEGLKEKAESDKAKRLKERDDKICKTCGQNKPTMFYCGDGVVNHFERVNLITR